jgi:hypothetical protein
MVSGTAWPSSVPIPSSDSHQGDQDAEFATYVQDVTSQLQVSCREMVQQVEEDHQRALRECPQDSGSLKRLEEDLENRYRETERLIREEWSGIMRQEIHLRRMSSPEFTVPEEFLQTQKRLLNSI